MRNPIKRAISDRKAYCTGNAKLDIKYKYRKTIRTNNVAM